MHVTQLLHTFPSVPHVEVVETRLPEHTAGLLSKQFALARVATLALRQQRLCGALFDHLHYRRRTSHLRFGEQQMNMFGHDHVTNDDKSIALARLFENREKAVASPRRVQKRQTPIAGT